MGRDNNITMNQTTGFITALLLTLPVLFGTGLAHGQIYQWKDENGKIHFSDTPVNHEASTVEKKRSSKQQALKIRIRDHARYLSHEDKSTVHQEIKNIYDSLVNFLVISPPNTVQVNTHIFATQGDMQAWCTENHPDANCDLPAMHFPGKYDIAVVTADTRADTLAELFHEASHALVPQIRSHLTPWLLDAFTLYFDGLKIAGGYSWAHPNREAERWIKASIRQGEHLTVTESIQVDPAVLHINRHGNRKNPESYLIWSVLFFLMSSDDGKATVKTMLEQRPANFDEAVEIITDKYPGGISALEYNWHEWCQKPFGPHRI